jgi:pantoate--beta-alanine ligase
MQAYVFRTKSRGISIGFVPTMGALHDGHVSLIRRARKENEEVIVSVFVNPLQFGPKEDFKAYPRPLSADKSLCLREHVDVFFCPSPQEMFPNDFCTSVELSGPLTANLCGAFRPGHFKGVATVVLKLFNLVQPNRAYFGEKDYQQVRVIQRMVQDLSMPVHVVACPTIREADGLAVSSRNRYLSRKQREEAVKVYQSLYLGRELVEQKIVLDSGRLIKRLSQVISTIPSSRLDYISIADPLTLEPMNKIRRPALLAIAVRIGKTRLIDNVIIT